MCDEYATYVSISVDSETGIYKTLQKNTYTTTTSVAIQESLADARVMRGSAATWRMRLKFDN